MNYLDYVILSNTKETYTKEETEECYRTLEMLAELLMTGKKEGLLAMEETACQLSEEGVEGFFRKGIIYMVDGHDPLELERFLSNEIVLLGGESIDGYLRYLFMRGLLAIQQGVSECLFYREMLSYLPLFMREEGEERMREAARQFRAKIRKRRMAELDRCYPRSTKSPYLPIIVEKVSGLSDEDLKRLLFTVRLEDDLILFSYVPEGLRTRMFRVAPEAALESFLEEPHYFSQEELDQAWLKVMTTLNKIMTKY